MGRRGREGVLLKIIYQDFVGSHALDIQLDRFVGGEAMFQPRRLGTRVVVNALSRQLRMQPQVIDPTITCRVFLTSPTFDLPPGFILSKGGHSQITVCKVFHRGLQCQVSISYVVPR